jgi:hypothetical protein
MDVAYYTNKLPVKNFRTWNDLLRSCEGNWEGRKDGFRLEYVEMGWRNVVTGKDGETTRLYVPVAKYQFALGFLKARCFEEVMGDVLLVKDFTIEDWSRIRSALQMMGSLGAEEDELDKKVRGQLELSIRKMREGKEVGSG